MTRTILGWILPSILFPILAALAAGTMFGHLYESGLDVKIANGCAPGPASYHLSYTGFNVLDGRALCSLVAFFHAAMESKDSLAFLTYFMGVGVPLVLIPTVEGWRAGQSRFIAYPVIFGCLCQTLTVGVATPLYWLVFIVTGGVGASGEGKISQAHAEALVFGIITGAAIPSIGMLILQDPYVTAIWQAFPIYMSIAQSAHLIIRPASKYPESGYRTIQALYIGTFILCSSVHFATMWPIRGDTVALNVFLPSFKAPSPSSSMASGALHFLQWDFTFGFLSSAFASLWFAKSFTQLLALTCWMLIAIPIFGPGAAMMAVALWRETHLQEQVTHSATKQDR